MRTVHATRITNQRSDQPNNLLAEKLHANLLSAFLLTPPSMYKKILVETMAVFADQILQLWNFIEQMTKCE
jgi:hypothetical protein